MFKPPGLWSFITAALVALQHPRNSSHGCGGPQEAEQATLCARLEKFQPQGRPARGDHGCPCREVQPRGKKSRRNKMLRLRMASTLSGSLSEPRLNDEKTIGLWFGGNSGRGRDQGWDSVVGNWGGIWVPSYGRRVGSCY